MVAALGLRLHYMGLGRRSFSPNTAGMLPFNRLALPSIQAVGLLALKDPISTLESWLLEKPESLAPVLHEIVARLSAGPMASPLTHSRLDVSFGERTNRLDLLLLPSMFAPEAWSFTFLEGLLRKPAAFYRGKQVVELGTGSGWVSLALLRFTEVKKVMGVDLNPQAILLARINAVLNGFDHLGCEIPDRLYRRFEAEVSDLLETPRERGFTADLVLGCIPQVISQAADLESTQGLYDLSNYSTAQGLVEDQFGLGLNARALRDALSILDSNGSVILNLAGRPGPEVVSGMFHRRGYSAEVIWRTRVMQAADTDIAPLVELEARSGRPFAFHVHRHSAESVSARLAQVVLKSGQPIFHELQVIEGKPRSEALFPLARALDALGLKELWERVDLSAATDEQLRFVARLAEGFVLSPYAPYTHEAGDLSFRRKLTDFLRKFHGLELSENDAFIGPDRAALLTSLLIALVKPGARVVVSESLRAVYSAVLSHFGADPIWVHGDGHEIAVVLPLLKPRLVLLDAGGPLRHQRAALDLLLSECESMDALLILDESADFKITSHRAENPMLSFLAVHSTSGHLAILFGLVHSQAFPDVELAILLNRYSHLHHGLEAAAEITYSRISWFHQAYYETLFDELLSFRINAPEPMSVRAASCGPQLTLAVKNLLQAPALARPAPQAGVQRLDFGENELEVPPAMLASILQGFLTPYQVVGRDTQKQLEHDSRAAVCPYVRATRMPSIVPEQILLGQGTLPLLVDSLNALARMLGRKPTVLIPQGSYGMIPPLLLMICQVVHVLPSTAPDFLATHSAMTHAAPFDVLLLTNPANPSGASYTAEALQSIIKACAQRGAHVILDEVFGLLAHLDGPLPLHQDRWKGLSEGEKKALLIVGGVSKEFAAGGLRFGFAASADSSWLDAMAAARSAPLPQYLLGVAKALFTNFEMHVTEIEHLREKLCQRRGRLATGLRELGFHIEIAGRGGLFFLVDTSRLDGGDPEGFVLRLEADAGVRLNTPAWSGLTSHARACFAIPEARVEAVLERLRSYLKSPKALMS
jgi:aspartate/methionine/tyrosine aminotransferase/methylase of polypeptide subunit release factors